MACKVIIDRTVANETLENMHYKYKKEQILADKNTNEEERRKIDLLIALENSHSFANTHTIIVNYKKLMTGQVMKKIFYLTLALIMIKYAIFCMM